MYQSAKTTSHRDHKVAALKIGVATLLGLVLPLLVVDTAAPKFTAETRLKVEGASDATLKDAVAALHSSSSLDNLIQALNLGRGGEFSADRPSMVRVVSDIVSGAETTVSQAESRLRDKLSRAIASSYDRRSGQATIAVTAEDAPEAARIANMAGRMLGDGIAASGAGRPDPLVDKLRQTLDSAEAALSGFITETGEQKLAELRRTQTDGQQLNTDIADAESQLAELKQRAVQAAALTLDDVVSKPLPDNLDYTGLDYQRQRLVEAKLAVDQLAGNLGPRHPRLQAAQATLTETRSGIQTALKQLVGSLRQQETAAARRLADLKAKLARKPHDREIAQSAARLATLEAAASEARTNYLEARQRTDAQATSPLTRVSVLAAASAANAVRLGASLVEILGCGALAGFGLGAAFAILTRRRHSLDQDVVHEANAAAVAQDDDQWEDDVAGQDDFYRADSGYEDRLPAPEPAHVAAPETAHEPVHEPAHHTLHKPTRARTYARPYLSADETTPVYRPVQTYEPIPTYERAPAVGPTPAYQQERLTEQAPLRQRYPDAANDVPLAANGDGTLARHIREVLMANRRSAQEASVPPLVAAVMAGGVSEPPAYTTRPSREEPRKSEDARELRRHMAELRERVETYSASRGAGRR